MFEEFKGREPIVRPGIELHVSDRDFDNPYLEPHYYSETSGSTGAGTRVQHELNHLAVQAVAEMVTDDAHDVLEGPRAVWRGILPDSSGINTILRSARYARPFDRWFAQELPRWRTAASKYTLATYGVIVMGKSERCPHSLAGVRRARRLPRRRSLDGADAAGERPLPRLHDREPGAPRVRGGGTRRHRPHGRVVSRRRRAVQHGEAHGGRTTGPARTRPTASSSSGASAWAVPDLSSRTTSISSRACARSSSTRASSPRVTRCRRSCSPHFRRRGRRSSSMPSATTPEWSRPASAAARSERSA